MKSQTFGEKISFLREENQYTLKYVSEIIAYNTKSLRKVERNQQKAPERIIEPLAKLFAVSYKELMIKYLSEIIYYQAKKFVFAEEALKIAQQRLEKEGSGTQIELDKSEILKSINTYFYNKPVEKVWLFGSFARDSEVSFDSDIDILVEFKKPNKMTLFDLIEMKADLSEKTGREIDLVEKGQELKSMRNSINQDKILVYEK